MSELDLYADRRPFDPKQAKIDQAREDHARLKEQGPVEPVKVSLKPLRIIEDACPRARCDGTQLEVLVEDEKLGIQRLRCSTCHVPLTSKDEWKREEKRRAEARAAAQREDVAA